MHQKLFHKITEALPLICLFLVGGVIADLAVAKASFETHCWRQELIEQLRPEVEFRFVRLFRKQRLCKGLEHSVCQQSDQRKAVQREVGGLTLRQGHKRSTFGDTMF